jgi:hypothetical protein
MALRYGKLGEKLGYGVWVLPVAGPRHELILVAVQRDGRMVGNPVTVPWGGDGLAVVEQLWLQLEDVEPPGRPALIVHAAG